MRTRGRSRTARFAAVIAVVSALVLTGCNEFTASGWGLNISGQLGDGTYTTTSTPVATATNTGALAGRAVVQVSAGYFHTCALASDGTAACWGANTYGQLGPAGPPLDSNLPIAVPLPAQLQGRTITRVAAGDGFTCLLTSDSAVYCFGRLGTLISKAGDLGISVTDIAAGRNHACLLTSVGRAACWGNNNFGQLGDGTYTASDNPVPVATSGLLAGKVLTAITTGDTHTCALISDGTGTCWGSNVRGELGSGSAAANSPVPVAVSTAGLLAGKTLVQISGGQEFTCAVVSDATAACWGFNGRGQLGQPTAGNDSRVPVAVDATGVLAGATVTQVSAGHWHACSLADDGSSACWGYEDMGQLGNGVDLNTLPPNSISPVPAAVVDSLGAPFTAVDAGGFNTAAINRNVEPSRLVPIDPVRVLDTRQPTPTRPAGSVAQGAPVEVDLSAFVPAGTTAVTYNLTATGQTASGYATVTPGGGAATGPAATSTVNWMMAQQTIANGYIAKVSADRRLALSVTSTGTSQLVLDLTGYFAPGVAGGGLFTAIDTRIYDSRNGDGPLLPGATRSVNINDGVPLPTPVSPNAAAVNVTVTGTQGPGVLTAAKLQSNSTSTVNWTGANQMIANEVIIDVAPDGSFTLMNNGPTATQVVVDLAGFFTAADAGGIGASFYPLEPARTFDSRIAGWPVTPVLPRVTTQPVPSTATAVAMNVTVTGTVASGYLGVTPAATSSGLTSLVNWNAPGTTRANGAVIGVNDRANLATVGGGSTYAVYDLGGYFQ